MAICKGILLLLATVAISTVSCDSSFSPSESNEILRNFIVTDSNILLGSSDGLYRLSLDLQEQERRQLDTPNRLLVTDPDGTYAGFVFTCGTSTCSLSNIQDLSDIRWQVSSGVVGPDTENVAGIFAPGPNGTSSLTYGQREYFNNFAVTSAIKKGDLISVNLPGNDSFGAFARQDETDNRRERRFLTTFSYENYVYFVTMLQLSAPDDDDVEIRVFRFCHEDQGIPGPTPLFASRYEIVLQCSHEDAIGNIVGHSATFVESVEPFGTESILIGVVETAMKDQIVDYACNYSLDEINRQINQTLEACLDGPGENEENVIGFTREDDVVPCRSTTVNVKECSLFGPLSAGLEVKDPLTETPFLCDAETGKGFSSIVYTSVDGYSFLFAGTSEGTLHQFYIQSPTEATKVRDISLDTSSEITELLASNDGETIYALTSKKLFQHPVDVCDMFTTCDECVTSPDPICGWCTLQRSCTRSMNCMEGNWVDGDDSSFCPVIQSVTPSTIYFSELNLNDVIVSLSISNIQTELDYACIFDFPNTEPLVTSAVSQNTTHLQCLAPAENVIPPIPAGEDTVTSTVSLRYEVTDIVTLQDAVGFANCAVHTSCTSCINSRQGCEWCPFTFHCIDPLEDAMCNGNNEDPVTGGCPLIRSPEDHENYLIHVNIPQSLVIESENLDTLSSGHLSCQLLDDEGEVLFSSSAELANDGINVRCMEDQFNFNLSDPKVETTLKILWKDQPIDNPNNTGVTLYSCASLGTNCAQCLSIPAEFNCHYCLPSISQCMYEDECSEDTITGVENVDMCSNPVIEGFWPTAGPIDGGTNITITGTNLGAEQSDIVSIRIDEVNCTLTYYEPGVRMNCTTLAQEGHIAAPAPITVKLNYIEDEISSTENFEFKIPQLVNPFPVDPRSGPEAGGTVITVRGTSLNIGSSHRVELGQLECTILDIKEDSIQCVTPPSARGADETFRTLIEVFIDNWSGRDAGFIYKDNPEFLSIEPNISFVAGGTNYTVRGTNLDTVQSPRLLFFLGETGQRRRRQIVQDGEQEWDAISEPCVIDSESGGTTMQCVAPFLDVNSSATTVTIGLLMDGVTSLLQLNNTVTVYLNPTFTRFDEEREFDEDDEIVLTIEGSGYTFLLDQVVIRITPCRAAMCLCAVTSIDREENTLECEVSNAKDLEKEVSLMVTVHLGNQTTEVGTIRIEEPQDLLLFILIPTFISFIIVAIVIFIVVVAVFCRKTHQKDQRYDQLILELEKLESSVARECKLGFAELQTDLDELTGDVAGCRLPYRDLHQYMLANLFPGIKDHPIMHELEIPAHRKPLVERALRDFYEYHIMDKKVLLVFIRTLEEQRSFTIHDKSVVGSLLMVTLHSKMDYATEVLKSLLAELIRRIVNQSHPKLLLRRTECVAERMLTNWLAFCLHGYIMEHGGQPMYLLYRAVKNQLEKGPIDVITGEARYSLSEQKLIRQKMDVETINATVETEDGLRIPVKVLDMDTISQAKEKLLDAVFKAAPTSQRPSLTSVELEYMKSPMEHLLLRDEDPSTIYEADWKRINTLRHYKVLDGAIFRLTPRRNHPPPGRTWDYPASLISTHCPRQRALSEAEDGTRVWHLFKQLDVEDPKRSPFLNKKMVTEIYLPRMLSTKSILQKFVDDLFISLFSVSHPPSSPSTVYAGFFPHSPGIQVPMGYAPGADAVPMAVKYLFDFLDDEAENARIVDPDVVHTWKNNALSLRFWVNMIKNPEFVFDINKSHTVDACLSVIAQAYIDGCSSAEVKLTIDSPTSKLLYNKEVQGYKAQVKKYYDEVQQLPRVPEDAMQYYLKQLSSYQTQLMRKTGGFVTTSALYEVLRYGIKYHEPFLLNLRAAGLESKAQMFEGVLRVAM